MPEEKKIIVDEDWKSQVQAEKEAVAKEADKPAPGEAASAAGAPSGTDKPDPSTDDPEMPPASLELLISSLVTETLIALGQIPHPATGEAKLRKNQAKYLIDTIAVLHEKTKGNVSKEEEQYFEQLLHQLRMAFVGITSVAPADVPPSS